MINRRLIYTLLGYGIDGQWAPDSDYVPEQVRVRASAEVQRAPWLAHNA